MKTVAQILQAGPERAVQTVEASDTVYEALSLMAQADVGALVVMEGGQIAGIVSERDYARKIALMNRRSKDTLVREVMSARVLTVNPGQNVEECMVLMTEHRLRHLPVVVDGRLIGIVSIGDLVKATISEQKFIIEQLEHYIAGDQG